MRNLYYGLLAFTIFLINCFSSYSQLLLSFNITQLRNPAPGYLFTGPVNDSIISIYDNSGLPIYFNNLARYDSSFMALRILENGKFAAFGVMTDRWFLLDKNLNVTDSIKATSKYSTNFHTLHVSTKGNYLLLANDLKKVNLQGKVPGGQPDATIVNLVIQELDSNKNLVFQWDCYEHIPLTEATEDIDLTSLHIDPYHINQVVYDSDGNIIVNFRNLDAIYKINRSTGNVIWIWGGSKAKSNHFTFLNDTINGFFGFSHQHDPNRLENGNILLFDNGNLKPNQYSRAVEYRINETAMTAQRVWEYRYTNDVFAEWMGNAQRLPNGNTLIGWGGNYSLPNDMAATEVTPDGKIAFEMRQPNDGTYHGLYQTLRFVYKMDAVTRNVTGIGTFSFNDSKNTTGISMIFNTVIGSGFTSAEKHYYLPFNIDFTTDKPCYHLPFRWVIRNSGISDFSGKLIFDLSTIPNLKYKSDLKLFGRESENSGSFTLIPATYFPATNKLEANISKFGEFFLGYSLLHSPLLLNPKNDTNQVPTKITLRWASNTPLEKYHLQVSTNRNFTEIIYEVLDIMDNEVQLDNLENYTDYYWRVKSSTDVCESNWSFIYSFKTIIGTPALVIPIDNSINQPLSGKISWLPVVKADKYKLQISDDSIFTKIITEKILKTFTFFDYSDLKYNSNYYWRVSAAPNYGKYGAWSDVWSFSTYLGKIALQLPANNEYGLPLNGTLKWNALPLVTTYLVQFGEDSLFIDNLIDSSGLKSLEIPYKSLENSKKYYWRVSGTNGVSNTEWSDRWSFITIFGKPTLVLPKDSEKRVAVNGNLTWKSMPEAAKYLVEVCSKNDFSNPVLSTETYLSTLKYTGLGFEKIYFWRVRAVRDNVQSDWSDVFSFETQPEGMLLSPVIIYPAQNEYKISVNVDIQWNEAYNAQLYDIQVATDIDFQNMKGSVENLATNHYQFNNLDNNVRYYTRIKSKNTKSESDWSEPTEFTTMLSTPKVIYPLDKDTSNIISYLFKWEPVESADFYRLQVATNPEFTNLVIVNNELKASQFDFTGMLEGVYYYWHISAYNENNESEWTPTGKLKLLENLSTPDVISEINDINIYPVPVNSASKVSVSVKQPRFATIDIINSLGSKVAEVENGLLPSTDNLYNLRAENLAPGSYCLRLTTGNQVYYKTFVIIR